MEERYRQLKMIAEKKMDRASPAQGNNSWCKKKRLKVAIIGARKGKQ
jgi:hypothetical protein